MNPKRIAKLLREIAALQLELAEAFEEEETKPKRKRPLATPTVQASPAALDQVRRILRKKGMVA